jgi:hypothetical protein
MFLGLLSNSADHCNRILLEERKKMVFGDILRHPTCSVYGNVGFQVQGF